MQVLDLQEKIKKVKKSINQKLKKIDLLDFKYNLIKRREIAASQILRDIEKNHLFFKDWYTLNILLERIYQLEHSYIVYPEKRSKNLNFGLLYEQAKEYYKLQHTISLLNSNKIIFLENENGKIRQYYTEQHPITTIPSSFRYGVIQSYIEQDIFRYVFDLELRDLIKSELYSNYLTEYYNKRLLPFLTRDSINFIYLILQSIIDNFMYHGTPYFIQEGILHVSKCDLNDLINHLRKRFDNENIDFFIEKMIKRTDPDHATFQFFYYDEDENYVLISFQSLQILHKAVYSHLIIQKRGYDSNYKGEIIENLVHTELNIFDLILYDLDGNPLVEIPLLEQKYGDLDVLGYNNEYLILIEAKYWDRPILSSLEEQIEKFYKRCKYIEENYDQLGVPKKIDKSYKFLKIFYTPYAPYEKYKDIMIFPSRSQIIQYIYQFIPKKEVELLPKDTFLENLIQRYNDLIPYTIDVHTIDNTISFNKYRIQDAEVVKFDENEIIFLIFNLQGQRFEIYCELNEYIYKDLISQKIKRKDFLRIGIANILGLWNRMQLMCFKQVDYDELYIDVINLYREPIMADEVYQIFKTHNLNIRTLREHCIRKNQNIYSAIGHVLAMNTFTDFKIVQCKCGEVMSISKKIMIELQEEYLDKKIKCKYCDPLHHSRIERILSKKLYTLKNKLTDLDFKEFFFFKEGK